MQLLPPQAPQLTRGAIPLQMGEPLEDPRVGVEKEQLNTQTLGREASRGLPRETGAARAPRERTAAGRGLGRARRAPQVASRLKHKLHQEDVEMRRRGGRASSPAVTLKGAFTKVFGPHGWMLGAGGGEEGTAA